MNEIQTIVFQFLVSLSVCAIVLMVHEIFFIADIAKRDKAEAARVAVIVENAIAEAARGSYTMGRRIIDSAAAIM